MVRHTIYMVYCTILTAARSTSGVFIAAWDEAEVYRMMTSDSALALLIKGIPYSIGISMCLRCTVRTDRAPATTNANSTRVLARVLFSCLSTC